MNLGVWFDLRNPPGWRQDPARLAAFTLELCEEAELLGADSLWFSEHHGFEDGYLPQPLTFAAAAAARTTRVRLGTGILVAPLRKTAQLAEEAAVVDIISGGRLELGLGAGYRVPEFELFGRTSPPGTRSWISRSPSCADSGARRPHSTANTAKAADLAGLPGAEGSPASGTDGGGAVVTVAASSWPHYRDGLAEGGHDPAAARMGGGVQAYVTDDPGAGLAARRPAHRVRPGQLPQVHGRGNQPPGAPPGGSRAAARPRTGGRPDVVLPVRHARGGRQAIRAYAGDAPVQTLWLGASVAGLPEDLAARHVQTICTRLGPLLKEG